MNWNSDESCFLLKKNFCISEQLKTKLLFDSCFKGHVFIASSGTLNQGGRKIIALSKKALLTSAKAVNQHLQIKSEDRFLSVLPFYHISDLAVRARAYQAQAMFISDKNFLWSPTNFVSFVKKHKASIVSLVPTQIFDLVKNKIKSPKNLRLALVGGSSLNPDLCYEAFLLGWPIVPTYGMTELCSQVATATLSDLNKIQKSFKNKNEKENKKSQLQESIKKYVSCWEVLPHILTKIEKNYLCLKSDSLLSAEFILNKGLLTQKKIYKKGSWFLSKDMVFLTAKGLFFDPKGSNRLKVKSKLVFLKDLQLLLESINIKNNFYINSIYLLSEAEEREGARLVLCTELANLKSDLVELVKSFNTMVQSHEVISAIYYYESLPKTSLGKLKLSEVKMKLSEVKSLLENS